MNSADDRDFSSCEMRTLQIEYRGYKSKSEVLKVLCRERGTLSVKRDDARCLRCSQTFFDPVLV